MTNQTQDNMFKLLVLVRPGIQTNDRKFPPQKIFINNNKKYKEKQCDSPYPHQR